MDRFSLLSFGVVLTALLVSVAGAWPRYFDDDDEDTWNLDRRSSCIVAGGKCYASGQCCSGHVCAAFDDFYGLNPAVPGYCVREKDLVPCSSEHDCEGGKRCANLGRGRGRFCVYHPEKQEAEVAIEVPPPAGKYTAPKEKHGLGFPCEDDSDCAAFSHDEKDRLCCQDVKRYRQKSKRICDRVTSISVCISKRK